MPVMDENDKLNAMLAEGLNFERKSPAQNGRIAQTTPEPNAPRTDLDLCQWQVGTNGVFRPAAKTVESLAPGCYSTGCDQFGPFLQIMSTVSDDIVKLPESANIRVLDGIRKFWASRDRYQKHGLIFKRGVLLWGPPGCHAAGTDIVMFDGSLKKVEDVECGDLLMGPDGDSRKVLDLCRGYDDMFRITPCKGEPFDVNGHHILSLVRSRMRDGRYPTRLNTSVNEYLGLSKCSQRSFKLLHSGALEFNSNPVDMPMDPYLLGVWLGDGSERSSAVTTADDEIRDMCYAAAESHGIHIREERKTDSTCRTLFFTSGDFEAGDLREGRNPIRTQLLDLNLLENKHIPEQYMVAPVATRLQLLAGLIDTDGGHEGGWRDSARYKQDGTGKGYFAITQKRELLSRQIVRLARGLGFGVTIRPVTKTLKSRNFSGSYWRVSIYGDINRVPVRIRRKKAAAGNPNKDHLRTGIENIEPLGVGAYYGFTLSGDHLYMTGDCVVHHNSGKSVTVSLLTQDLIANGGIVLFCSNPNLAAELLKAVRRIERARPLIVVYEDIDEIVSNHGEHTILSLLDGEQQTDNLVSIATTNYPDRLGARIVNRPSRFDDRIFVGMPSLAARRVYLEKATGILQNRWAEETEGLSIAHLRELVAAVMCLDQDYYDVLKRLKSMNERPKEVDGYRQRTVGFEMVGNLGSGR